MSFLVKCRACSEEKPETEFSFKNKSKAIRHNLCKNCTRTYCAAHYREYATRYRNRAVANSATRRRDLHRRLYEYLLKHPCVDCGEADPIVLEFDHREAADKLHNLSRMWYNGYSWRRVEAKLPSVMSAVRTATGGAPPGSSNSRM